MIKKLAALYLILSIALAGSAGYAFSMPWTAQAQPPEPPDPTEKRIESLPDVYDQFHRPVSKGNDPNAYLLTTATSDQYGYTLDDTVAMNWKDATTGTQVTFGNPDDDYTATPINLGFNFKFYENSYSQVYVSTNGLLTFEIGTSAYTNQFLPQDPPPNNMIAVFWDDLELGSGKVYYRSYNSASGRYFVIEWVQVTHIGGTNPLTFEAILFENGDIVLQYQQLYPGVTGFTVGIENVDGTDGLLYLYNTTGLSSGKAIQFLRPPASYRVKALPPYQSEFVVGGQASFPLEIINIGELGADRFNLTASCSEPGWSVTFTKPDGVIPLKDTNQDGKVDTGPVSQGGKTNVLVQVQSDFYAAPGDYAQVDVTISSASNPSKQAQPVLQSAVPVPFSHAYADSQTGMYLNRIWKNNLIISKAANFFTGNTLALAFMEPERYIYAWELNGDYLDDQSETVKFSNIQYLILDRYGNRITPLKLLTDNGSQATADLSINARYPALAATSNGRFALLYALYKYNDSDPYHPKSNSNLYMAVTNKYGDLTTGLMNLTGNSQWRTTDNSDVVPVYTFPRIVATGDNRWFVSWIDSRDESGKEVNRLYYAIYNADGSLMKAPAVLSKSTAGSTTYGDPFVTSLSGGRVFLGYSVYDQTSGDYSLVFALLDGSGNVVKNAATIPGVSGWRPDVIQLKGGNILLAWTNPLTENLQVMIFNGTGEQVISGPTDLPRLGVRLPDYVSVTRDGDGHGVLTWMDAEWKDYIYYALVSANGDLVTPPMIVATGEASNPLIQTNSAGQGNAPYDGAWRLFLPLARRQ
ncbi:MAG: hypothetical protein P8074_03150 [Anaerolineales bacterium]